MGFLGKIGNAIQKIDNHISNDPEIVGKRFEDYVQNLFSTKYFKIVEKTHSFKTNTERYVNSSKNPDFIFEYLPTREKFAVECKYRTQLNKMNQLEWSYPAQLKDTRNSNTREGYPFSLLSDWSYRLNVKMIRTTLNMKNSCSTYP